MRVVVIGATGQLGRWLVRRLAARPGYELAAALDRSAMDLECPDRVGALFDIVPGGAPDLVLNAAAFTAVDRCESEAERARRINGAAPAEIARLCAQRGVGLVHVSTDFVFPGDARVPYAEDAATGPRSAYGRSKLEGERAVLEICPGALVVRSSWVFGPGRNFVRTMLELAERHARGELTAPLRVVDDQHGSPTYAADLADGLLDLQSRGARGLFQLCNAGVASWWDFARAALDEAGYAELPLERICAVDYKRAADVPMYSVMSCARADQLGVSLRPWREALSAYVHSEDAPIRRGAA